MEYTLDRFIHEIKQAIGATGIIPEPLIELQVPKSNVPADLALPCFRAAKAAGSTPPALASELAGRLHFDADSLVGDVAASGPFLNFTMRQPHLAQAVIRDVLDGGARYGHDDLGNGQTIVVDYSSPNVAKRMHVGHIRSTIIGQSITNILEALGYRLIRDNHLGDTGTSFGKLLYAIGEWGWPEGEGEEILVQLEALYQQANQAEAEDATISDAARSWSLKLDQNDPQAMDLLHRITELTLKANQRNYDRLGVRFDYNHGETFYLDKMGPYVEQALEKGIAYRDEAGAVVVAELEQNMPTFLLIRSDGGSLYHTRDLATIAFREETFHPTKIIYVVEQRQELHFRQLFALARSLGYAEGIDLVHIYFGTIFDAKGQPLSTRRGNMIFLETLLDDAIARARTVVETKSAELSEVEKQEVAEAVGIGAVIYNDLYQDLKRNITLDWERMLATEGNSATYLQYSYARCRSILRKGQELTGGALVPTEYDATLLRHDAEQDLLKHLARLPDAIREAGTRCTPHVIADWCYTTARQFATFYDRCSVLKADSAALRDARLALVAATAQALKNGLGLLGVRVVERM